jgi:hypothetical protein
LLRRVRPQGTSFSTMCGGGGRRRMGKMYREGRFLHDGDRSIDRKWWMPSSYGRHGATPPAIKHTTINLYNMRRVLIVKTRIYYDYYYFYGLYCQDKSTNRRTRSKPDVMVIPPMQSTGSNNHRTYTLYMSPLGVPMLV